MAADSPSPPPQPPPEITDVVSDEQQLALPHLSPKLLSPPGPQDPVGNVVNGEEDDHGNQPLLPPPFTPLQQQVSLPPSPEDTGNHKCSPNQELQLQPPSSPPPAVSLAPQEPEPDGKPDSCGESQLPPPSTPPSPAPQEPILKYNPNLSPNRKEEPQPLSSPPPGFSPTPQEIEVNIESSQNHDLSDNRHSPPPPAAQEPSIDDSIDNPTLNPNHQQQSQLSHSSPPGFSPSALPAPQEPDLNPDSRLDGDGNHSNLSPNYQQGEQTQLSPSTSPALPQFTAPSSPTTLDPDLNPNPTPMDIDQTSDITTDQDQQLPHLIEPSSPPPPPPPPASSPPPPPSVSLPEDPNNTLDDNHNPNTCTSPYQSPLQHSPTSSPPRDPENSNMPDSICHHSSVLPSPKSSQEDLHQIPSPHKSPPQPHSSPPPSRSPDPIPQEEDDQDSPSHSSSSTPSESKSPNSTAIPQPITSVPISMAASPPKKPIPWTHDETTNLVEAYQEKWYSLKRGQLKASQWEEVAITVAARCGYNEPTKTATQCRHKIEKLRKRYRTEKLKPRSKANSWNFFKLMDRMERGPLPISASRPLTMIEYDDPPQRSSGSKSKKKDDSDSEFLVKCKQNKSKSATRIALGGNRNVNKPGVDQKLGSSGSDRVLRQLRSPVSRKRKNLFENSDEEDEEEEVNGADAGVEGGDGVAQLAMQIRSFAERFVRMENKKIEMMRDTERYRMEMENKRMEMILETQQQLVETVHTAFSSVHKKRKL